MRRAGFFAGTLAASALWMLAHAPSAHAGNAQQGEALFREAKSLLQAGKVHEACEKFAASAEQDPQLGTSLNLASCHEKEGKTATALAEYKALIEAATAKNDHARVKYSKQRVADLEATVPRVRFTLAEADKLRSVELDEKSVSKPAWSGPTPLDPGEHLIVVTSQSGQTRETRFQVDPKPVEQTIAVAAPTAAPVASSETPAASGPAPSTRPEVHEPSSNGPWKAVGLVGMGVGAVGIAVGGVFGAKALSLKGDVDEDCVGTQCNQAGFDAAQDAKSAASTSTIAFIAGGACLAIGAVIYLLAPSSKDKSHAALLPKATPFIGRQAGWSLRW